MVGHSKEDPSPPTAGSLTAEAVGAGLRRGDADAVRQVRERVQKIVGFHGYGIPPEDRKDLTQQVMAQLWQKVAEDGAGPIAGFWGLVEVVAARRCIDWLRTRKHHDPLDVDPIDLLQDPHAGVERSERQRLARAALEHLPRDCRRLIYLHAGREMTYGEIASLLGKSEGALRVQMHRCLERARRALAELTGSAPR